MQPALYLVTDLTCHSKVLVTMYSAITKIYYGQHSINKALELMRNLVRLHSVLTYLLHEILLITSRLIPGTYLFLAWNVANTMTKAYLC